MGYLLAVDLGTTFTAAAVWINGRPEVVQLGSQRPEIPSLVYINADGTTLIGEAAERRGIADSARLAREFKRRLGDPVPIRVGESPYSAHALMARMLRGVLDIVAAQQEEMPARVCITCPANWGPYKRELIAQLGPLVGLPAVEIQTEPEAAAVRYAATDVVEDGDVVAVYDLGGGTFDAAVLRKLPQGFEVLGSPTGIEQLGGMDFDHAVLDHVTTVLGPQLSAIDMDDPTVLEGLTRLRRDCIEAKEALSYDTEVAIPVAMPSVHTRVRLTRAELEAMIEPVLSDTLVVMDRVIQSAGIKAESLRSVLLAGGSTRIPRVSQLLTARYRRPLVMDSHPEHSIALGASMAAGRAMDLTRQPTPTRQVETLRSPVAGVMSTSSAASTADPVSLVRGRDSIAAGHQPTQPTVPPRPDRRWLLIGAIGVAAATLVAGTVWVGLRGRGSESAVNHAGSPNASASADSPGIAGPTAWARMADLPVALEGAAVAAYQERVWVAGGLSDDAARTKLSTVFILDPRSNTWTTGPALPQPISHGSLVATPWTLYFIGGWVQDGGSAKVLKLNDTNTAWVQDVPLPSTRVAGAGAYDGSSVIYAGGTQKGGEPTDTVWALREGRWREIGHLAHKRQKVAAVSNNVDTVWVLGGRNQMTDTKYGDMDRISQGRVMPVPASRAAPIDPPVDSSAAVQLSGYGICLVGGEAPDRRYSDWWCEQSGVAQTLPKLEPQRAGLGVAKIGNTIYVVGGYGATFQGTNRVEALTPTGR